MTTHHPGGERVLVIGAGPAGLSAALRLHQLGHRDVVVHEIEPVVGGKCKNFEYGGFSYDLGANLTTPRYTTIRPLVEQLGIPLREMPERRVVAITDEEPPSLTEAGFVTRQAIKALAAWYVVIRKLTGIDRNGYAGLRRGVMRPFAQWLDAHKLGLIRPIFANLFVAYGYGVMDDLPAAYALKFFDPIHLFTAINTLLGDNLHTTKVLEGGFQRLWVRLVEAHGLHVRTSTRTTRIERGPDGVYAEWEGPDGAGSGHFDRLILACPPERSLEFLDATDEERSLFGQIEYYDYYVTACLMEGLPDISTFVFPYSMRLTPGQPTVFYPPVPEDPHDLFMFYSYGNADTTEAAVHANIRRVVELPEFGGTLKEILHTQHWRYFPHVQPEVMQAGFYDRFEALQGQRRTLYVGEALSFTLVELVTRHAFEVVERHVAEAPAQRR